MNINNLVHISVFLNGDFYGTAYVSAVPFIGAGLSVQESTLEGSIVMKKLRVQDVTFFTSGFHGKPTVNVYCTERE